MKGITWNGEELGASFDIGEIPDSLKDQVRDHSLRLFVTLRGLAPVESCL